MSVALKELKYDDDESAAAVPSSKISDAVATPANNAPVPIRTQPVVGSKQIANSTDQWMYRPIGIHDCPPGLVYLKVVDQLLIKQKVELMEGITGCETNNKYIVKNALGQNVYYAIEDCDDCQRSCLGSNRAFVIRLFDNFQNEVLNLIRPCVYCISCSNDAIHYMDVIAPPNYKIGRIEQQWAVCTSTPRFNVKNHQNEIVLYIEGESWSFTPRNFKVLNLRGQTIGTISKQWSGLVRELFTDADFFGINFPLDLETRTKALLLGATFLIDMKYFES